MSVFGWHFQCDICGASSDVIPDGTHLDSMPDGWLQGSIQLHDRHNKEGVIYGNVCPECAALPIRDLIVRQAAYRARKAAVLA
jgi:hypothetical protein